MTFSWDSLDNLDMSLVFGVRKSEMKGHLPYTLLETHISASQDTVEDGFPFSKGGICDRSLKGSSFKHVFGPQNAQLVW